MSVITFASTCWENDWDVLLKTNYLRNNIIRNFYNFDQRVLLINNVNNCKLVVKYAKILVKKNIIDDYVIVEDYVKNTLDFFKLTKDDLGKGYFYSIAVLVSIYVCTTDFMLYYTGDSILKYPINWISEAIDIMNQRNDIKVANLCWNNRYFEAKNDSISEVGNFYIGTGFSDQCFLIKTENFRAKIYNEKNAASERYPNHARGSFEERVDSWMRNNNYKRITHKTKSYFNNNFIQNKLLRNLKILLGLYNQ